MKARNNDKVTKCFFTIKLLTDVEIDSMTHMSIKGGEGRGIIQMTIYSQISIIVHIWIW